MSLFNKGISKFTSVSNKLNAEANKISLGVSKMNISSNKSWKVTFNNMPKTLAKLKALPEAGMREPHYTAALLIPALCLWPENKEEALNMINFLKGPQPLSTYEVQFITNQLKGNEYLPFSYFEGATPENGYEPAAPYTITVSTVPTSFAEEGYAQLYLRSGGADSPRPVKMRHKPSTSEWFLWEQMLLSGIRKPVSQDPWA